MTSVACDREAAPRQPMPIGGCTEEVSLAEVVDDQRGDRVWLLESQHVRASG